jgi:hypothetical protein
MDMPVLAERIIPGSDGLREKNGFFLIGKFERNVSQNNGHL